jgi:hypothetical protein
LEGKIKVVYSIYKKMFEIGNKVNTLGKKLNKNKAV